MKTNMPDISRSIKTRRENCEGIEPKFWVRYGDEDFLFKHDTELNNVLFGEVFVSALCRELGIKCVETIFATCKFPGRLVKGSLSKSYIDQDVVENISLSRVQQATGDVRSENNGGFSPDGILENLKKFVTDTCVIEDTVRQDLVVMAFFDYLTAQVDRHGKNIEFLVRKTNGQLRLSVAPMFDNGRCFGLSHVLTKDKKRIVTGDLNILNMKEDFNRRSNPFLNQSFGIAIEMEQNPELRELFERVKSFDISVFLRDFLDATGEKLTQTDEYKIVETWKHKVQNIESAVERYPTEKNNIEAMLEMRHREKFAISIPNFYLNYYYDVRAGECEYPLVEYERQKNEYVEQCKAWKNLETNTLKPLSDYPLLTPRCSNEKKAYYLRCIKYEREDREVEMEAFEREFLVPDYLELELLQNNKNGRILFEKKNKDIVEHEKLEEMWNSSHEKRQIVKEYSAKLNIIQNWIAYGEAYCPKPTLKTLGVDPSKKYDKDVVVEYIDNHASRHCNNKEAYESWLKSVGMLDYAKQKKLGRTEVLK